MKLQRIRDMGRKELEIFTDYDYTLTKEVYHDGEVADSSFKTLHSCDLMT
jgi:hypothetical protein